MTTITSITEAKGKFLETLTRTNSAIKRDRALSIAQATLINLKRRIEDIDIAIMNLTTKENALIDLSPTDANSLVHSKDFDPQVFVESILQIGLEKRNLTIQKEVLLAKFNELFENE